MSVAGNQFYLRLQAFSQLARLEAVRIWKQDYVSSGAKLLPLISRLQVVAATEGASYVGPALLELGQQHYRETEWQINPQAWATHANSGYTLNTVLNYPAALRQLLIEQGWDETQADNAALASLQRIAATTVIDSGGDAASIDFASRGLSGYVRCCQYGACDRCVVLAGRFYRWNANFDRHPNCLCYGEPAVFEDDESAHKFALSEQLRVFNQMTGDMQDYRFGKAAAEAIRAGADIGQVVNSKRGRKVIGQDKLGRNIYRNKETKGGTIQGYSSKVLGGVSRSTVSSLLRESNGNREMLRVLLEQNGYIVVRNSKGELTPVLNKDRSRFSPPVTPDYPDYDNTDFRKTLKQASNKIRK